MKIEPLFYLKNGLNLLWENRKTLFWPTLLSSVFSFASTHGQTLMGIFPSSGFGGALLVLSVLCLGMYFSMVFYTIIALRIDKVIDSDNVRDEKPFSQSLKCAWKAMGILVGMIVILVASNVLFGVLYRSFTYYSVKFIAVLAGVSSGIVLFSFYNIVFLSVILDFRNKQHYRRSAKMLRSDFGPIVLIMIVSSLVPMIPTLVTSVMGIKLSTTGYLIKGVFVDCLYVFLTPYSLCVQVPLYRKTKENISEAA